MPIISVADGPLLFFSDFWKKKRSAGNVTILLYMTAVFQEGEKNKKFTFYMTNS